MGICYILDHVRLPDFADQQYDPDVLIRFDRRDMTDQQNIQLRTKQGTRIMFLGAVPWAQKVRLWWSFIADNNAEIEQSIRDWHHHSRFDEVNSSLKRLLTPPLPEGFKG